MNLRWEICSAQPPPFNNLLLIGLFFINIATIMRISNYFHKYLIHELGIFTTSIEKEIESQKYI